MIASGRRSLITGASGSIGSHLVARLIAYHADVRILVRSQVAIPPEAPLQVTRFRGDVTDVASLDRAVDGCDVVFHCAWGGKSLEEARRINVYGTRNLVESAARAGVRRIVHMSSMAVHGHDLPPLLTEDAPLMLVGTPYEVSKAEGEAAAFKLGAERGVEIIALRPTRVYGPGAPLWLMSYFERCRAEEIALIDGGKGFVNLIHLEDLIEAMLLAASCPGVAGQAFLLNGPETVTWGEYIGHFARMLRKPMPPSVPLWRARAEAQWSRVYSALMGGRPRLWPMDLDRMSQQTVVTIAKAGRLLGWKPRVSLEQGMEICEAWLRREGYLPAARRRGAPSKVLPEPVPAG